MVHLHQAGQRLIEMNDKCKHTYSTQDEQGRSFCSKCGALLIPEYETGNKRYPREEDDENNEEGA